MRDRILALTPIKHANLADTNTGEGNICTRPIRIHREECDVEMLSLADFDIDEIENEIGEEGETNSNDEDNEEDVRARISALLCIEQARICWCSTDFLVSAFESWTSSLAIPSAIPTAAPSSIPQSIFTSQAEPQQRSINHQLSSSHSHSIHSQSNSTPLTTPLFETQEDIAYPLSISSPSSHSCMTPGHESVEYTFPRHVIADEVMTEDQLEYHFDDDDANSHADDIVRVPSPLGAGYGMDSEYNDFLEFFKGAAGGTLSKGKEVPRTREMVQEKRMRAFQLDCENGCVEEV